MRIIIHDLCKYVKNKILHSQKTKRWYLSSQIYRQQQYYFVRINGMVFIVFLDCWIVVFGVQKNVPRLNLANTCLGAFLRFVLKNNK